MQTAAEVSRLEGAIFLGEVGVGMVKSLTYMGYGVVVFQVRVSAVGFARARNTINHYNNQRNIF